MNGYLYLGMSVTIFVLLYVFGFIAFKKELADRIKMLVDANREDSMYKYVKKSESPVYAMATIGTHSNPTFKITVNPDMLRVGDPYFKMYLGKNEHVNDGLVRISFLGPYYITHSDNRSDRDSVEIKRIYKKSLIEFMDKSSKVHESMKMWDFCKFSWNNEYGEFFDKEHDYLTNYEAYMNGFFDTPENLSHPSYLPSTLTMPDYMQL